MLKPSSLLTTALLAVWSCAGKPGTAGTGIAATATGSLSISATPIQTIAPSDSEGIPVFGNIADATRLSSGMVVVVDRRIESVTFVDTNGVVAWQSGRTGDGPGEFRFIRGIGQCAPDTLFVWDHMNGRMNVLGPDGAFLSAYRPQGDPVDRYCASSRQYLVWTKYVNVGNPSTDSPPIRAVAVLLSATGDSVGSLGEIQAGQDWPLGAITQLAVTDAGVYIGTADTAVVSLYGWFGQRLRSVEVGNAHLTATAVEYDAALTSLISTVPGTAEQAASMREFMLKRFPMPKYLPAYRAIFTNGNGALFVVTSPLGDGVTELQVFDQSGANIGEVHIPVDLEVFEIGTDYLLGMSEDAAGEQRLVLYSLLVD